MWPPTADGVKRLLGIVGCRLRVGRVRPAHRWCPDGGRRRRGLPIGLVLLRWLGLRDRLADQGGELAGYLVPHHGPEAAGDLVPHQGAEIALQLVPHDGPNVLPGEDRFSGLVVEGVVG